MAPVSRGTFERGGQLAEGWLVQRGRPGRDWRSGKPWRCSGATARTRLNGMPICRATARSRVGSPTCSNNALAEQPDQIVARIAGAKGLDAPIPAIRAVRGSEAGAKVRRVAARAQYGRLASEHTCG